MKIDIIRDVTSNVAGKNTGPIVNLLFDKKNVNEFLIAKKLGLTINQTRNILYKLSDEGLVSFVRKKDKKKGWYTYFWTFNTDKALLLSQKNILKEIEDLEIQLKGREMKRFYVCPSCNAEISEETALVNNFICPECGEVYVLNDNKKSINDITLNINKLRRQLTEINQELDIINAKKIKKTESDKKKFEKEKIEKRRASQIERKKLKQSQERLKNLPKKKISSKKKLPKLKKNKIKKIKKIKSKR